VPPRGFHMTRYSGIFAAHARGRHALTGRGMRDWKPGAAPSSMAARKGATTQQPSPEASPARPSSAASLPSGSPSAPNAEEAPRSSNYAVPPLGLGDALAGPDDPARQRRLDWAKLMKRTWGLDVLACPRCNGKMTVIALIDDERVARKILRHLGLPSRAPPRGRPWRPGQQQLVLDDDAGRFDGIDPPAFD